MKIFCNKKTFVFITIMLFFSTCFYPSVVGNEKQSTKMKDLQIIKEDVSNEYIVRDNPMLNIQEVINLDYNGHCTVQFKMVMPASPFADIYQEFLNFSIDTDIDEEHAIPVPSYAETYSTLISQSNNWTSNQCFIYPSYNNVKEQIVQGIIQEQFHSFGILINENSVDIRMWGVYGGVCGIIFHASGDFQNTWDGNDWTAYIGPLDTNHSFDRASYNLLKIGYLQDMIRSSNFAENQKYICNWDTTFNFDFPIKNQREIFGKGWVQDFGNGTFISANIDLITSKSFVLSEQLIVDKNPVIFSVDDLLSDGFLCYKIFNVKCGLPKTSYLIRTNRGFFERLSTFNIDWSINLMDLNYTIHLFDDAPFKIDLHLHQEHTISGCISGKWGWFDLKNFKTWMQIDTEIDLGVELKLEASSTIPVFNQTLFTLENNFIFIIGVIPIDTKVVYQVNPKLEISVVAAADITIPINFTGSVKAGVGWKKKDGWYPISDANLHCDVGSPEVNLNAYFEIKPSVGFKVSLIFYEVAGPSFTISPFIILRYYVLGQNSGKWVQMVGIDILVGISWSSTLKSMLDLEDVDRPVLTIWLFISDDANPPPLYDVWVLGIRSPLKSYLTEEITFYVDVVNIGTTSIYTQLELKEYNGSSYNIINSTSTTLGPNEFKSLKLTWNTSLENVFPFHNHNHLIRAEASIPYPYQDGNISNNVANSNTFIEILDMSVIDIHVPSYQTNVIEGQTVDIYVDIENSGFTDIKRVPTFAYYNDPFEKIGDTWCDCMKLESDFLASDQKELHFTWDTLGVNSGTYLLSSESTIMDYEINRTNNLISNGSVTITASTNNPPTIPQLIYPPSFATDVDIDVVLAWNPSFDPDFDPVKYDVYFGDNQTPVMVAKDLDVLIFNPQDILKFDTTYYWKVIAWDNNGASNASPIWSFTTQYGNHIFLKYGWNWISFNVIPFENNMLSIVQPLVDEGSLEIMQDGGTGVIWPDYGINTIGDMDITEGYKVKVNWDTTLSVRGIPVRLPVNISLSEGWNLIGYPNDCSQNALDVVQSLIDEGSLITVKNSGNELIFYNGSSWINEIGDFEPNHGYYVKVNQDTSLSIFDIVPPNSPPEPPIIIGPFEGLVGVMYEYVCTCIDPDGDEVFYWVDWGDGSTEEWIGPFESGSDIVFSHIWEFPGEYFIVSQVMDVYGAVSDLSDLFIVNIEGEDTIPPESWIEPSGDLIPPGMPVFADQLFHLMSFDEGSGVDYIFCNIFWYGALYWNGEFQAEDWFILEEFGIIEGDVIIEFYAVDFAGNTEESQIHYFEIIPKFKKNFSPFILIHNDMYININEIQNFKGDIKIFN